MASCATPVPPSVIPWQGALAGVCRRAVRVVAAGLAVGGTLCAAPLKIMPLGDSITAGYTDNPTWSVPFEFGYRGHLHTLLASGGYDFQFVGASLEPFNNAFGDPTHGGTVSPAFDLRPLGQNGHRGYGGVRIDGITSNIAAYLAADNPDIILLMIGINGIGTGSPGLLDTLVNAIVTAKPAARLIVAQITPKATYNADLFNYNSYIRNTLVPKYAGLGKHVTTVDQYVHLLTNPADAASINPAGFSNGINHPTQPVYQKIAVTWFAGIQAVTMLDTDNDQLSDIWERAKTGNLTDLTQAGDFDHDGLSDLAEYQLSIATYPNLHPAASDTDADGLSDGEEVSGAGRRPATHPTLADSDRDQVGDRNESNTGTYLSPLDTGTNPMAADSDGDGSPDGAEILEGSSPLAVASPAAPLITSGSNSAELYFSPQVSTTDLLQGLSGGNAVHSGWNAGNNASPAKLNDGVHGGTYTTSNVEGAWAQASGSVSTFTLPPGGGNGWDLSSITSFAAWVNAGFGNQKYDVSVRRAGDADFSPLASVNYQPFSVTAGGATKVVIQHPSGRLASGVVAIRFSMRSTNGNGGGAVYRELDVQGTPTLAPPPRILEFLDSHGPTGTRSLSWSSRPAKTYRVDLSGDLKNWIVLAPAYPSGGVSTRYQESAGAPDMQSAFYRISEAR